MYLGGNFLQKKGPLKESYYAVFSLISAGLYIYIYIKCPLLIKCSISYKIDRFNWIMVKDATKFQVLKVHVNNFTIFSFRTTPSTGIKKSLQCKGILFF